MNDDERCWLLGHKKSSLLIKILRWTARVWSLLALLLALVVAFSPDENATTPVSWQEAFILSLWLIAILGLVIAWRWEFAGAFVAIITMLGRELLYIILFREWWINFLLIWALVIPPAVMYLIAWSSDRKHMRRPQ